MSDLDNQTYKTDILTVQKLTIGNSVKTCIFSQNLPGRYINGGNTGPQDYRDIPVILLATDEIAINGDAYFPGGTYAELRITCCGSQNRIANDELSQLNIFLKVNVKSLIV